MMAHPGVSTEDAPPKAAALTAALGAASAAGTVAAVGVVAGLLAVAEAGGSSDIVVVLLRWMYRVTATLTVGYTVTAIVLVPKVSGGKPEPTLLRPAVLAAVALAGVSAAQLGARAALEHGPIDGAAEAALAVGVMTTGWAGLALALQVAAAIGVAALASSAAQLRATGVAHLDDRDRDAAAASATSVAALLALMGVALTAAVGHGDSTPVTAVVRVLHAVGAAMYVGNLVGLLTYGAERFSEAKNAVRKFHIVAMISTITLLLTGLALAAGPILGEVDRLTEDMRTTPAPWLDAPVRARALVLVLLFEAWPVLALAKLSILILVIFTAGAVQKMILLKGLFMEDEVDWDPKWFRLLALLEVAVLLLVFAMTSAMLTYGPPE